MREGSNGFDPVELRTYLAEIDTEHDELDSLLGSYRESCKGPRGRIASIKAKVKKAGVNPVAFNELVQKRQADRRHKKRLAALDLADAADFSAMEEALGDFKDTPLGAATLDRARAASDAAALERVGRGEAALDTL
jgi:hypothetical protein